MCDGHTGGGVADTGGLVAPGVSRVCTVLARTCGVNGAFCLMNWGCGYGMYLFGQACALVRICVLERAYKLTRPRSHLPTRPPTHTSTPFLGCDLPGFIQCIHCSPIDSHAHICITCHEPVVSAMATRHVFVPVGRLVVGVRGHEHVVRWVPPAALQ